MTVRFQTQVFVAVTEMAGRSESGQRELSGSDTHNRETSDSEDHHKAHGNTERSREVDHVQLGSGEKETFKPFGRHDGHSLEGTLSHSYSTPYVQK